MAKAKFIDVDGHIMEPSKMWEEYIDPEYKDRAMGIGVDEQGLEYLKVDGDKAWFTQGGMLGALGAIGQDVRPFLTQGKITWEEALVPGGYDPQERIKVMDAEEIDVSLLYPSLGLDWEQDCPDPKLAAAYCRAYNNWLFDFCEAYPDRMIPVAHLPMIDVGEAAKELKRTAQLGAKAAMLASQSPSGHPYGSPYYDPLWEAAQEADIPVTLHPALGTRCIASQAYPRREDITTWWVFVLAGEDLKINFTSFFNGGTFEHFPFLKVVILESGIGWLAYWIDRMDEKFEVNGFTTPMKQKPNEYFQRQCWAVMDPDERLARFNIEALGADKFMWAYDYPHSDSVVEPVSKLKENLSTLPEEAQRKVFGENAIDLYKLG